MLLKARFVARAAQTHVLLVILVWPRCYASCLYVCCCRFYVEGSSQKVGWRWATGRGRLADVWCVGRPGLVCVERAVRMGGCIGGGDAARRLPSFSAAPTLSSPRSVINLASEILNLAPPAYRFFYFKWHFRIYHAQLNLLPVLRYQHRRIFSRVFHTILGLKISSDFFGSKNTRSIVLFIYSRYIAMSEKFGLRTWANFCMSKFDCPAVFMALGPNSTLKVQQITSNSKKKC